MKRIEAQWLEYMSACMDADIPDALREVLKQTFFAGARSLYRVQLAEISPGPLANEADAKFMAELGDELLMSLFEFAGKQAVA